MENQQSISQDIKYQIKLITLISLGVFLFPLFFSLFELKIEKPDDQLMFLLGLAAITFLILALFRILLPFSVTRRLKVDSLKISNEVGNILLVWIFITAANICYLFFVGNIELSLAIAVKISIFSSLPSIILKLADVNMALREQLKHVVRRNVKLEQDIVKIQNKNEEAIVLRSENQNENLEVAPSDILLVKAADNYVSVVFKKDYNTKTVMLRTTLKNINTVLSEFPDFLKCHRSCIVNSSYILNMTNSYKGHRLLILDYEEEIPVSRQYILSIKDALDAK